MKGNRERATGNRVRSQTQRAEGFNRSADAHGEAYLAIQGFFRATCGRGLKPRAGANSFFCSLFPLKSSRPEGAWSIADPWTLELDSLNSTVETQSFVLTLGVLRLLPPVQEVQPKPKRTKTSKKTASTSKSPRKPGRPRQKAA